MKPSVIVWDLETVPDLGGFAAANDLVVQADADHTLPTTDLNNAFTRLNDLDAKRTKAIEHLETERADIEKKEGTNVSRATRIPSSAKGPLVVARLAKIQGEVSRAGRNENRRRTARASWAGRNLALGLDCWRRSYSYRGSSTS